MCTLLSTFCPNNPLIHLCYISLYSRRGLPVSLVPLIFSFHESILSSRSNKIQFAILVNVLMHVLKQQCSICFSHQCPSACRVHKQCYLWTKNYFWWKVLLVCSQRIKALQTLEFAWYRLFSISSLFGGHGVFVVRAGPKSECAQKASAKNCQMPGP